MGTFTTSKQFQLGLNIINPWWLSGASVDLDFPNNRYYDSSLTALKQPLAVVTDYLSISRASIGYAKTSGGMLTQFPSNQFRATDLGLLIEDARTNIVFRSEELQTWQAGNITITQNATVAPDGATTADKIVSNVGSGTHSCYQERPGRITSGNVAFSCFFKAAGYNYGCLSVYNDSDLGRYGILVNLTTGAITSTNTTGTITVVQAGSVEAYGNGWWRVSLVIDGGMKGVQTGACDVATPTWAGAGVCMPSWSPNGTDGIYAWGLQVEAGSFPSSYILCTTDATARAADNVQLSGPASTITAGTVGSVIVQSNFGVAGIYGAIIRTAVAASMLTFRTDNLLECEPAGDVIVLSNAAHRVSRDKSGISWNAISKSLVLNAGTVATEGSPNTTFIAPFGFGSIYGTGTAINGYFERLTIWNTRLADATLQALTA